MKPKEKQLLSLLFQSQNRYLTSREISAELSISERTVRTYIHRLESVAAENGGTIEAKQGQGYRLILQRPVQFEVLVSQNRLEALKNDKSIHDTPNGRRDSILSRLLLNNETVDPEELADSMFISASTLKKDLLSLKQILDGYGLSICTKNGVTINGDEERKRALIMDYFFRTANFSSLREYMDHSGYFDDIPLEMMLMIILEETRKENIRISDVMVQNTLMHLALSIKRIQSGQNLLHYSALSFPDNTALSRAASSIMDRLSEVLQIDFPQEEVAYLTLHLGVKTNGAVEQESSTEDLRAQINGALERLEKRNGRSFQKDDLLKKCLFEHLQPMLLRLKQGIQQMNPLTDDLKRDQSEMLDLVKETFREMPCLAPYDVSDDEWAYLAIHLLAARERLDEQEKLQVLVICATGYGSSQLLKSRLQKFFGNSIHIVSEAGYYDMNESILKGIDLIISSVNMGPVIFGVPFLYVSVFLSDADIAKIQEFITQYEAKTAIESPPVQIAAATDENMNVFDSYLTEERFLVMKGRPDYDTVIETLTGLLSDGENEAFVSHMKDQIQLRTQMGSVAFSDSIAVPHPAVPIAKTPGFALAILPEGMEWDSEHPMIRFVFLMSPSYVENPELSKIINGIIALIDLPDLQDKILQNPAFSNFRQIFTQVMK